jgi:type III secretion protein U
MSTEKTEQPTDKKLNDARDRGEVPISQDLAHLVALVAVAETAFLSEPLWREAIMSLFELSATTLGRPFRAAVAEMLTAAGFVLAIAFAALCVVAILSVVGGHWGQTGIVLTAEPLAPKMDKLNPVNGFKQMFSMKKLTETVGNILKTALIGFIMYLLIRSQLPTIVSLAGGTPRDIYYGFFSILRDTFHILVVVCLAIALIDFALQKYIFIKGQMMSLQDIKNEQKETEGDPLIKNLRRQLARELIEGNPVAKTQNANAVVVNPTHFAVAMLYDPQIAGVPFVLAKGRDDTAQAMIQRAKECGIPVIRHVWLARTLYATCRENTVIPRSSYEATALVYAVVQRLNALNQTHRDIELESRGEPPEHIDD